MIYLGPYIQFCEDGTNTDVWYRVALYPAHNRFRKPSEDTNSYYASIWRYKSLERDEYHHTYFVSDMRIPSLEDAMKDLDRRLLYEGCKFISAEQFAKLSILV